MSVQSEITRIQNARNTLRTKAVALGIGTSTDTLDTLATDYNGIVDNGTPSASIKEGETYTLDAGYYHGGTIKGVAGGGSYDLQTKSATPSKSEQTIGPDTGYYGLSSVTVNPIPDIYQDVSSVNATASDVLSTKTFVTSTGVSTAGTMTNNGAVTHTLDTSSNNQSYTIPQGYHNGSGSVNIVTQTKSATPSTSSQTISPDSGKVLSSVTVNAIPVNYGDATDLSVTAATLIKGKTAIGWDSTNKKAVSVTGAMDDNGALNPGALDCGESYTIPAGYTSGGKVTANSLASQTTVDAGKSAVVAAMMVTGYQAWVNGEKISGSMPSNGDVSGTITGLGSVTGDTYVTIPSGYTTGGTISLTTDIETALAAI